MKHLSKSFFFFFIWVVFVLIPNFLKAQIVDYGQNPPNLYWNRIKSSHFLLVFPSELGQRAEKLVNILERVYQVENHSISVQTQPITIILQNQSIESNAFVLLSPRRSEFNTLPPQDLEPIDWINSLAIHEMRHVVQMDRVFNGKGSPIFETLQLGIFGLIYPPWFFEGDAVDMETILSEGGRGRLPSWEVDLRANVLSAKNYSYSKYTLGSWKDNVPDYYRIGYFMVTKMRRDFGDSIFNQIFKGSIRISPYPFSSSLKRNTGMNSGDFFLKTMAELKKTWRDSLKITPVLFYPTLNHRRDSTALNFFLPKTYKDGKILFLKSGLNILPTIFALDPVTGEETKIIRLGNQTHPNFDYHHNLLVWDEIREDPRYQYRSYSDIFTYEVNTKRKKRITFRSKLFSPNLNPKGSKIVVVEVLPNYTFQLKVLDVHNPRNILNLPNPHHYFFENPQFDSSGTKILCVAVNSYGKALYEFNLFTNKEELLKPFSYTEMNRPVYGPSGSILYHSAKTGKDQIVYYLPAQNKENILTASIFGAEAPFVQGDTIWFQNFSSQGQNLSRFSLAESLANHKDSSNHFIDYYKPLTSREPGGNSLFRQALNHLAEDSLPAPAWIRIQSDTASHSDSLFKIFPISKFKEITHLFYFHSLLPDVQNFNVNQNTFLAGLKLTSTNLLNTTQTYGGIYYQNGLNALEYQIGFTYKKYYPHIILNFIDKKRNALAIEMLKTGEVFLPYSYRSRVINFGLNVPLNFIGSTQNYGISLGVNTSFQNNYDLSIPLIRFSNFNTYIKFPLHYTLLFEKNKNTSIRDIYPQWGQNISLDFEHLPLSNNLKGHYFAMNSGFYFPGIFDHHSLRLGFNYQYTVGAYTGQRSIDEINGFSYLPTNQLQNTFLVDYTFPIAYPDWEIGRLAYLRRFIGGVFYNQENLAANPQPYKGYRTFGAKIRVDLNLLRFYLPIFQFTSKIIFFQSSSGVSPKLEFVLNYTL